MEDRSDLRIRSLGRKRKLILAVILVTMGLALVLRVLSIFFPRILPAMTNSVSSFLGSTTFLAIVAIAALSLVLVSGGRRLVNCWLRRLFLPHKRTNVMVPSVSSDKYCPVVKCGSKKNGEGFAISMLRLLSVPRDGVRQRVRGAVARDEQEEGAAVSDEKQYQFSHLESLSRSEEHRGCVAYELQFKRGLVNVGFTLSAEDSAECRRKREQVKANLLTKFPVQLVEASREHLNDAALMSLPWGVLQVEAMSRKVARILGGDFSSCVAVVALRGRPEMAAHEQRCQIDQLITGINSALEYRYQSDEKRQVEVNFVVPFEPSKPPKYPSDASLRERLREKPEVKLSLERKKIEVEAMEVEFGHRTGWWKVSPYAIVLGVDRALVEEKADCVADVVRSVWSGSHFSPNCTHLHSREVVKYLPMILRRALLPRRYVTEMSSIRLSSLVHIPEEPHPPLSKVTPPPFEAPHPTVFGGDGDVDGGCVRLGDVLSPVGGVLYPLTLPISALGTHVIVLGESGFGKTCLVIVLLIGLLGGDEGMNRVFGGRVPFLVLDQKGEYRCLVLRPEYGIAHFLPASETAPLWINLFDPQGDDPESHAKRIFNIVREILFANRTELSPQMERVFYDVLRMTIGGDWMAFNENLSEYLKIHGWELPQLEATIQGILNRVGQFTCPPLSYVFDCRQSNVCFPDLVERSAIIDLSEVRRRGTPEDVRLVANIIGKYVSVASLNRGADFGGELKHLLIVDDALDVVPEVLTKKTTADVGTIEYMAILLRATGQGLVMVSQRPNIAENVMGNAAVKVFFRTVVDSRELATWVNLSEEQAAYLKVLPQREAIITVPQHTAPMRIRIPDVSSIVRRKVTNHDIITNNMINYPLMYDMQREEEVEAKWRELPEKETSVSQKNERQKGKDDEGRATAGKEKCLEEQSGQGGSKEDRGKISGGHEESWQNERVSKLNSDDRDAWLKLRGYFDGGMAVDSELVSSVLGISRPVAHREMLALRRAGLIGLMKIPNYGYGRGFQYAYYSSSGRSWFGSGVVGYIREKLHGDLTGREVVVELSPTDVPSADMVIQHRYPVIIHVAGSSYKALRLSALRERLKSVVAEFSSRIVGQPSQLDGVVVVTLWAQIAKELDYGRRNGELEECLCVIPFCRRSVELLADYVLGHVTLGNLAGNDREGEEELEKKEELDVGNISEVRGIPEEGKEKEKPNQKNHVKGEEEAGEKKRKREMLKEKVLGIVKEFGGVEPHVVAERLGVRLSKVSQVAGLLEMDGFVRIARNIPDLKNLDRPNVTFYLDPERETALHDTVMNLVWEKNISLGGGCKDYSFEYGGKTWHTDGLLGNIGVSVVLEVVAGNYEERVVQQIKAYSSQVGYMGIRGVVVVFLSRGCLEKVRSEVAGRGISLGDAGLLTALRSRDEKLQFENLLLRGKPAIYHRNATVGS
nr:hypothetical protein [Candidatus Njordarchaeota archaeon]